MKSISLLFLAFTFSSLAHADFEYSCSLSRTTSLKISGIQTRCCLNVSVSESALGDNTLLAETNFASIQQTGHSTWTISGEDEGLEITMKAEYENTYTTSIEFLTKSGEVEKYTDLLCSRIN